MVTIQDTELREGVLHAIGRAKALNRPILVSVVYKVAHIEPIHFFEAGRDLFLGERFYWKDPAGDHILVGLGISTQIRSDQAADRFFHVEKEWESMLGNAVVYNDYPVNGVGPSMFGGFSFDPLKEKSALWSKFSDSLFHVPKYMLSVVNGQTYLTMNVACTQHDDLTLLEKTAKERENVLSVIPQDSQSESTVCTGSEEVEPENWKKSVAFVVDELKNSDLKKVVLARELRLRFEEDIYVEPILSHLMTQQQESFIFAFESNGDCFIGASPERLVKKNGEDLFSTCLAGSIGRGKTPEEDLRLGEKLLNDQKNLIEHQYVVDMIKEAMAETCEEVIIPEQPRLMKIRDIQHLYTPVIGKNREGSSLLRLVDRLHPTPALGGLPKEAAVEKIRQVEILDRGLYAAPIGWLDYKGNGEFAVAIRSGLIQGKNASLFAGSGVVADSDPESEYLETRIKFRPMLTALGGLNE